MCASVVCSSTLYLATCDASLSSKSTTKSHFCISSSIGVRKREPAIPISLRGAMNHGAENCNFGNTTMIDKEAMEGDDAVANLLNGSSEKETGRTPFFCALYVGALILAILIILTLSWMYRLWKATDRQTQTGQEANTARVDTQTESRREKSRRERIEFIEKTLRTGTFEKAKSNSEDMPDVEECWTTESDELSSDASSNIDSEYGGQDPIDQCAICLAQFVSGDEISLSCDSQCLHLFHRNCIFEWLVKHKECPYCRRLYLANDALLESVPSSEGSGPSTQPRGGPPLRTQQTREVLAAAVIFAPSRR